MKSMFPMLIMVLFAPVLGAAGPDGCLDENTAREAAYHLNVDPITTKEMLSSAPGCDDVYALMHKANVEIAKKCREEIYYQGEIHPTGWFGSLTPNAFEKYVMENPDQFDSAREGIDEITANDYWINKIKNRDHPVVADFEYQKIKLFYDAAWEDGDGSMHSGKLIGEFTDWIRKHPTHVKAAEARQCIEFMKNYRGNGLLPGE